MFKEFLKRFLYGLKVSLYALASGISFPALALALGQQAGAEAGVKSSFSGSAVWI